MHEIIIDTILDLLKLLPFLFIAFLIIEIVEHNLNHKYKSIISKSGSYGPLVGSLLGLFPQCGFGALATNLYITKIISLGTLIAIYLSTSDEMLPILISEGGHYKELVIILVIKFVTGLITGYIIDFIYKQKRTENYHICEEEHCDCKHNSIFLSSFIHTIKTVFYIGIITLIMNIIFTISGENFLQKILMKESLASIFISSLIGLIPNCSSSIIITELFINKAITLSTCISGLLTNSGIALLILFKSNKNIKENISIIGIIYITSIIVGILLECVGI